MSLHKVIRDAYKTDLLENIKISGEVNIGKNVIRLKVSPYEIATIKLDFGENALS